MGAAAKSNPFTGAIESEYDFNMEMAKRTLNDAKFAANERRAAADKLMGEQISSYGVSGVELEGSPEDLITNDLKEAEQEAMNIIYTGKVRSNEMKFQAAMNKQKGYMSLAKDIGSLMLAGGAFKGGAAAAPAAGGTGMNAASTGTKGFSMSESSSVFSKSSEAYA